MDRGCALAAEAPYADTIFLRRGIDLPIDDHTRARLALAAVATGPAATAELLGDLLAAPDPDLRYAAGLQLGLSAERAGAIAGPEAALALDIMANATDLSFPRSDQLLLEALRFEARGERDSALARARAAAHLEPRFFNAQAMALRLLTARTQQTARSNTTCARDFAMVLESLAAIADLEPCVRIAAHLEVFLARAFRTPADVPGFAAAQVYLAVLAQRPDLAQAARDRFEHLPGIACRRSVGAELDQFLALLEGRRG